MVGSQTFFVRQDMYGTKSGEVNILSDIQAQWVAFHAKTLENFLASGLGSRGGPNKVSNKMKRCPSSYLSPDRARDLFIATGLGSHGGPNKESNKLKRSPASYLYH